MSAPRIRSRSEIRAQRHPGRHPNQRPRCFNHLIAAALWPMHGVNLGTLLRTCDAAGACMAVPKLPWVPKALEQGNTLRRRCCVHWIYGDVINWLERQRETSEVVGVELTDESIRLADLPMARRRTVIVLGNETTGIPPEALELLNVAVEIPQIGTGGCLNVAVAGSLVLFKIAGLS
jgi:tRNA G18 (ribose-2'-O)-methylase SpoU